MTERDNRFRGRTRAAGACGAIAIALLASGLSSCGRDSSEPAAVGGPALVRRLTEAQYRATIADVFAPDVAVVARFEPPLRENGLIAVGTSKAGMSPFSVEQYDAAAVGIAAYVLAEERRDKFVSCQPQPDAKSFDPACAKRFVEQYGLRLFRRPLTEQETIRFVNAAQSGQKRLGGFYDGLQFGLVGLLTSPEFLLRVERSQPDPENPGRRQLDAWSKATRLSYFLTGSTPDDELLRAAGAGELDSQSGIKRQVDRLIASPHFARAVRAFFADMLRFDMVEDTTKDPVIYPAYTSQLMLDAREQTLLTITDLLVQQDGDYRDIFTTRQTFLTRPLGIVYRLPAPSRYGWEKAEFPEGSPRAGIQSHISFLALNSHPGRSSATLRGLAIREVLLCQEVPDPPGDVDFTIAENASNKEAPTARDRMTLHSTSPTCAGCHKVIDPIGLTLENFDGLGGYRLKENDALIDPSGDLDGAAVGSSATLAKALHDHPGAPQCLVDRMYQFAVGREKQTEERPYVDYLTEAFQSKGYRLRALMRDIAVSDNFFAITSPKDTGSAQTSPHEQTSLKEDSHG